MVDHSPDGAGTPSPALLRAMVRVLRPLVRLLIREGITLTTLTDLLKQVYVQVARDEFRVPDRRLTDSRISLITGVHRKDVKRLREVDPERFAPPAGTTLGSQVIGVWLGSDRFRDVDGAPRALPRTDAGAGAPSFDGLVASVSKDVRPRTLLDEWLRAGIVSIDANDQVCLQADAFVPREDLDQLLYYFGRNLHDHMASAVHNLSREGTPFLERSVHYDGLSAEAADALAKLAREEGMRALIAVNRQALEYAARDRDTVDAVHRINLGLYFHASETEPPRPGDDAEPGTSRRDEV